MEVDKITFLPVGTEVRFSKLKKIDPISISIAGFFPQDGTYWADMVDDIEDDINDDVEVYKQLIPGYMKTWNTPKKPVCYSKTIIVPGIGVFVEDSESKKLIDLTGWFC